MTIQVTLQAEHQAVTGKAVRQLRRQGILPTNLTGRHVEPLVIQVKASDVSQLLKAHGRTTVIRLSIPPEAEPHTVMIGHLQREPVSAAIDHRDCNSHGSICCTENCHHKARVTAGYAPFGAISCGACGACGAGSAIQVVQEMT